MSKLDRTRPFGTIYGHPMAAYEQDRLLYDANGNLLGTQKTVAEIVEPQERIVSDNIENAKTFLMNILKNGSLSKSAVYKVAESNNQDWNSVKIACDELKVAKFTYNKSEMWKLQDE